MSAVASILWVLMALEAPIGGVILVTDSARNLGGAELIKIGDLHEVQNHLLEAQPYYERAVAVFHKQRNRQGEATALGRLGALLKRQGRLEEALHKLQGALALWGPGQQLERGRSMLILGEVLEQLGRLEEAQRSYAEAQRQFEQAGDAHGRLQSMVGLGAALSAHGRSGEASRILERAVEDAESRHDRPGQLMALLTLGDVKAKDQAGAAITLYEQALRLSLEQGDVQREAGVRVKLSRLLEKAGRRPEAMEMATKALALYQSLRDRVGEADMLVYLGELSRAAGDLPAATDYHERALGLYRALRDRGREAATLLTLSGLYSEQGAQQTAEDTQEKARRLLSPTP
jgi:tetratricopeptide (TPR) repeat protein